MKSTIFFVLMALSLNANAAHWECKSDHQLKQISFDLSSTIENFKVVAPELDQKEINDAFKQVNSFTLVAYQVIDTVAQETIDYTLIIDQSAKSVSVLSQWSTNENVDSETIKCIVSK